jgi:fumarate hydratase class II
MARRNVRIERDTMGDIEVPAERLWGAQTQRSLHHFHFPGETMPQEVVRAQVLVKKAAAVVNMALGVLDRRKGGAIIRAADEALAGRLDAEFPLVTWQTGSGTQTNMNVNEVLANRASELMGGARGEARLVHPNDDVNKGQSSNDTFPTAMHVAATIALERTLKPAVKRLRDTLAAKSDAFMAIVKIGRTHLQDATPLTLGQEFSGYVAQLDHGLRHIEGARGRHRPQCASPLCSEGGRRAEEADRPAVRHCTQQVRSACVVRRRRPCARGAQDARRLPHEDRQ